MQRMLDFYNLYYQKDSIKICVFTVMCFDILAALNFLTTLELKIFFRPAEKLNKMDMNKWISNFMTHLRKSYINDDLAFVYND